MRCRHGHNGPDNELCSVSFCFCHCCTHLDLASAALSPHCTSKHALPLCMHEPDARAGDSLQCKSCQHVCLRVADPSMGACRNKSLATSKSCDLIPTFWCVSVSMWHVQAELGAASRGAGAGGSRAEAGWHAGHACKTRATRTNLG